MEEVNNIAAAEILSSDDEMPALEPIINDDSTPEARAAEVSGVPVAIKYGDDGEGHYYTPYLITIAYDQGQSYIGTAFSLLSERAQIVEIQDESIAEATGSRSPDAVIAKCKYYCPTLMLIGPGWVATDLDPFYKYGFTKVVIVDPTASGTVEITKTLAIFGAANMMDSISEVDLTCGFVAHKIMEHVLGAALPQCPPYLKPNEWNDSRVLIKALRFSREGFLGGIVKLTTSFQSLTLIENMILHQKAVDETLSQQARESLNYGAIRHHKNDILLIVNADPTESHVEEARKKFGGSSAIRIVKVNPDDEDDVEVMPSRHPDFVVFIHFSSINGDAIVRDVKVAKTSTTSTSARDICAHYIGSSDNIHGNDENASSWARLSPRDSLHFGMTSAVAASIQEDIVVDIAHDCVIAGDNQEMVVM